jgi:polyisoprenoid-binding protein YceI
VDAAASVVAVVVPVAVIAIALRTLLGDGPGAPALRSSIRDRRAWFVVAPVTAAVMVLGVPYAYVEWGQEEAPPPLAFAPIDADDRDDDDTTTTRPTTTVPATGDVLTGSTLPFVPPPNGTRLPSDRTTTTAVPEATPSEVEGVWKVGRGSIAGYRAAEVLVVQDNTAAGRTDKVTGDLTIAGTTVTAARFVVDMNAVVSDSPQRDQRYREIMDTGNHSTSRLVLTQPIEIETVPPEGEVITRLATGEFTIRGVTRTVTFDLEARRVDGRIELLGSIPVKWSQYGIPDPGNGVVRVHDHGTIEFLLYLDRV